eukprot:4297662-Amphidinium_carterae.1
MQKVKDAALRRRQEMILTGRPRTNELEDEFHSLKKTTDGSIRLVCFRCWNEFENTTKYSTENGKPSNAFKEEDGSVDTNRSNEREIPKALGEPAMEA